MSSTEHPQTAKLAALEKEKERFRKEALNYKAKVFQLEKERELVTRIGSNIRYGCHCTF
jgi:hypothetical protein